MNRQELRLTTYQMAAKYGAYMGLFLVIRFAMGTLFATYVPMTVLYIGLTLAIPYVGYKLAVQYKKNMQDETLLFGDYYTFTFFLFFFSSIILTFVEFIYYRYISPDYISNTYHMLLSNIDVLVAQQPELSYLSTYKTQLMETPLPTAFEMAAPTIWMYSFWGIVLGLVTALLLNKQKNQ